MSHLVVKFKAIRENNGLEKPDIFEIKLKRVLNEKHRQFKSVRRFESERVTVKKTSDKAIQITTNRHAKSVRCCKILAKTHFENRTMETLSFYEYGRYHW